MGHGMGAAAVACRSKSSAPKARQVGDAVSPIAYRLSPIRMRYATFANARSAAATVAATSSSLCAADTKPASKADGAR